MNISINVELRKFNLSYNEEIIEEIGSKSTLIRKYDIPENIESCKRYNAHVSINFIPDRFMQGEFDFKIEIGYQKEIDDEGIKFALAVADDKMASIASHLVTCCSNHMPTGIMIVPPFFDKEAD